jgi:hypothetical protein
VNKYHKYKIHFSGQWRKRTELILFFSVYIVQKMIGYVILFVLALVYFCRITYSPARGWGISCGNPLAAAAAGLKRMFSRNEYFAGRPGCPISYYADTPMIFNENTGNKNFYYIDRAADVLIVPDARAFLHEEPDMRAFPQEAAALAMEQKEQFLMGRVRTGATDVTNQIYFGSFPGDLAGLDATQANYADSLIGARLGPHWPSTGPSPDLSWQGQANGGRLLRSSALREHDLGYVEH